ncbi:MAG: inorganic phosphate transporter [Methylobacter sp.]|uniref:inorganic phosphate transporter n=1 Tax=Methylobacter sp. TaxID=2051955 RepID=UPI002585DF00|nr:inorganic phosphate transporter [Methylobacter sp.]MCL7420988.1 inorganic phosphate transporter [Methylobacter sp.]
MDLNNINQIEHAGLSTRKEILRVGFALVFMIAVMLYVGNSTEPVAQHYLLIIAAVIGGYMALNIGANDVANNVGPAVGSQALTMTGAIIIAAIFEAAGALIAGGDVVGTIKSSIIDPSMLKDVDTFIWLMMAALLAGALWLNLATAFNAPVSTTHSIVGAVLGAGIAAGGLDIANWPVLGEIVASWIVSPVLGGIIAAGFLYFIKRTITYQEDMVRAATKIVPLLIALMVWVFSTYLIMKGLKHLWKIELLPASGIGLALAVAAYLAVKPMISKIALTMDQSKANINKLFTLPMVFSAALLSFAHGANDVANAVGPLAAINDAIFSGGVASKASIPVWVMMVGAIGISIGLALYGPKLIRTVGSEITELDKMRAFCIAMSAAFTVIVASQMGLPVSSTHTAVGAVFGVGFLREYLKHSDAKRIEEIKAHHEHDNPETVDEFLRNFKKASIEKKGQMLKELKRAREAAPLTKKERKSLKKVYRKQLVKRSHLYKIAAAWIITVPSSAILAGLLFFTIRGMMLP